MLKRIFIKDFLSIKSVVLDIDSNFVVFSGPSGAGKSIFMNALLSSFGFCNSEASLVDVEIQADLDFENFGVPKEKTYIFQRLKSKSIKYFLNNQNISKKATNSICSSFVNYLSLNDDKEFSNKNLLEILDHLIANNDFLYLEMLEKIKTIFADYSILSSKLREIETNEKNQSDLKDFLKYEIEKISSINPTVTEFDELISLKKDISKKEKISQLIEKANPIFELENVVNEVLNTIEITLPNFDDSMNELRDIFENTTSRLESLDDIDIENLLDRLEKLSALKHKYGSIEEALMHKEKKQKELDRLENITWEKAQTTKELQKSTNLLSKLSNEITAKRISKISTLKSTINQFLEKMYLKNIDLKLSNQDFTDNGQDKIEIELNSVNLKKISTGELNRVKLAFLATKNSVSMQKSNSILFLDEVDSNLSGKESMSVAKVLKELSKNYQIFAISHQPQLSSLADTHFLVDKQNEETSVTKLTNDKRVEEVARMVSADEITKEALQLATTLLGQ